MGNSGSVLNVPSANQARTRELSGDNDTRPAVPLLTSTRKQHATLPPIVATQQQPRQPSQAYVSLDLLCASLPLICSFTMDILAFLESVVLLLEACSLLSFHTM
jgi:hypothetical protein